MINKKKGTSDVPFIPVKIVSFTDPNDLLSYEVQPDDYKNGEERCKGGEERCTKVVNIAVSNTYTWFWLLENPLIAHTEYLGNPNVIKYIACGRESTGNFNCTN